jgi:hypothetical protein
MQKVQFHDLLGNGKITDVDTTPILGTMATNRCTTPTLAIFLVPTLNQVLML